jgi:hypothetical protein
MPLIKSWLSACEKGHSGCNNLRFVGAALPTERFLLIDISSQQIVPASLSFRYIALSYVWGGVEQLQLSKLLYPELTKPGGLANYEEKIPQTIKDAISVVSGLGEKYLWVDSLCIIQDSMSEKEAQIAQMAAIYDAALLTIVACTATNANDPLPGVQPNKRNISNPLTRQGGILFAAAQHQMLFSTLPQVSHSQRAWTFQEVLLSRRCLFFLNGEVMLQCQKSLFCERTPKVTSPGPMNQTGNWPPIEDAQLVGPFFRYKELVQEYTRRRLTFQRDKRDAFTGITKALELAWNWKFSYCLPGGEFEWAVMWVGQYSQDEETQWEEKEKELKHEQGFPSWSWLSHVGMSYYLVEKQSAGQLQSFIDWNSSTLWDGFKACNVQNGEEESTVSTVFADCPPGTIMLLGMVQHLPHNGTPSSAPPMAAMREEMKKQASYGTPCAPLIDDEGTWCGTLNGIGENQLLQLLQADGATYSLILLSALQKTWVLGGFRKSEPHMMQRSLK